MIIDAHVHLSGSVGCGETVDGVNSLLAALDEAGIDGAVVAGLSDTAENGTLLRAGTSSPHRLFPFAHLEPEDPRLVGTGWRGIGEIYLPCGSARLPRQLMRPIAEIAEEEQLPILMHSGEFSYTAPLLLEDLARSFPNVTWIVGHMGSLRFALDAIDLMTRRPNVFADTSGMTSAHILRHAIDAGCAERLLFGSDYPFWDPVVERTRIESARLDPGVERLILGENAGRLLNL